MANKSVEYELKVTNTLTTIKKRFIFSIPVKGGFVAHFKKFRVIVRNGENGINFCIVMTNTPEAMRKHTSIYGDAVENCLCVSQVVSMWRTGNVMHGEIAANRVDVELFKKICGEYSNCTEVYRDADVYVLGFRASERHNFDNTRSNCTSVDLETAIPVVGGTMTEQDGTAIVLGPDFVTIKKAEIPVVGGTMTKPDGTVDELGPGFIGHRKDMNPIDEMADKIKESRDDTFIKTAAAAANPVIKKLDTAEKLDLYQSEYDHLRDKYDILVERYAELEAKYKRLRDSMQKLIIKSVEVMTAKDDEALCQLVENSVGNLFDVIIKTSKEDE